MNDTTNTAPETRTPIIALDLGSSHVRAMAAEFDEDGKINVLGVESVRCKKDTMRYGSIQNRSEIGLCITTCLKQLQQRLFTTSKRNIEIDEAYVSAGSHHMQIVDLSAQRHLTNRLISLSTLDQLRNECDNNATKPRGAQQPQAHVYDINCFRIVLDHAQEYSGESEVNGKQAQHIEASYYLIVEKPEKHATLQETFKQTLNVRPQLFVSKVEALTTAVLTEEDKERGSVIIDCGAQTTTMIIYHGNRPTKLVVVKLGGDHITADITSLNVTSEIANTLKFRYVNLAPDAVNKKLKVINCTNNLPQYIDTDALNECVAARVDEIFDPLIDIIEKEADFAEGRIYLSGAGSQLEGLDKYLQQKTSLEVDFASHDGWLVDDSPEDYYDPALSMLVGTIACAGEHIKRHPKTENDSDKNKSEGSHGWFDKIKKVFAGPKDGTGQGSLILELFPDDKEDDVLHS